MTTKRNEKFNACPEHNTWLNMRCRCYDSRNARYTDYGGRGIEVCERWLDDFFAFIEDMGRRPEGMSLDRIDNDGDYTPENCRWATRMQQAANRRSNVQITLNGKTQHLAEWCRELVITRKVLLARVAEQEGKAAMTAKTRNRTAEITNELVEDAKTHRAQNQITIDGITKPLEEWAKEAGVATKIVWQRISRGMTPMEALSQEEHKPGPKNPVKFNGESKSLREWAEEAGVKKKTVQGRLDRGMTMEQALSPTYHKPGRKPNGSAKPSNDT